MLDGGDPRQPAEVVERRRVLKPEDVVLRHLPADPDGTVHVPSLVDIDHQIDVWPDGAPHRFQPRNLASDRRLGTEAELHRPEALGDQAPRIRIELFQGGRAPEEPALKRGDTITVAAKQLVYGLLQRLAFDVPQRYIDGRNRPRQESSRGPAAEPRELRTDRLGVHRIATDRDLAQPIDCGFQRACHHRGLETGVANSFDSFVGANGQRHEVHGVAAPYGRRILTRYAHGPAAEARDLHLVPHVSQRVCGLTLRQRSGPSARRAGSPRKPSSARQHHGRSRQGRVRSLPRSEGHSGPTSLKPPAQ